MDYDKDTNTIEILASNGDTFLGGSDLDNAVAKFVVDEFKKDNGVDLLKDPMAMQRIMEAVEKAKIELSSSSQTEINLPYITVVDNVPAHLAQTLSKARFENLIEPYVDRVIDSAKAALKAAKADKLDGVILVGGSCRIPYVQSRLEKELGAPLVKKADLDLAVAQGASIQANILSGNTSSTDVLLLDVTPLSLGIDTVGGVMAKLIDANTTIPTTKSEIFSTAVDNQTAVTITIAQGERYYTKDNKVIGQFNLDGIAPAPRGVPQLEVTVDIDASGIVTVTAKDKATGKEQHITIQNSAGLSKEEIERIKADAEAHKAEDDAKKAEGERINKAEGFIYGVETALKNVGDKLTDDEKKTVQEKLDAAKTALEGRQLSEIEPAQKALEEAWAPLVGKIYQGGQQGAQQGNPFTGFDAADLFGQAMKGKTGFQGAGAAQGAGPQTASDTEFEEVK